MNLWLGTREGLREMAAHKFRSFLTMLGIILGVASLMAMFSLTAGLAEGFRKALTEWGGLASVEVVDADVPDSQEAIKDMSPGRTYKDVLALRSSAPLVDFVSPSMRINGNIVLTYKNQQTSVGWSRGVEQTYLDVERYQMGAGRFFTDLDLEKRNRVVVIGTFIKQQLFGSGNDSPIGATISIDGHHFTVVGVFVDYDNEFKNRACVMPLTTVQELWHGVTMENGINQGPNLKLDRINVRLKDTSRFDESIEQMRNVLNQTHRGIQDYGFNTKEDWAESVDNSVKGVRISGGLIVLVTLIAGGIGITNIMLASIKERTREIGIRRAVGALPSSIFLQIALESVVLSIMAGFLGLAVGYGLVEILKKVALQEQAPILEWSAVFYSFIAAVVTGVLAGMLPAWKASQMNPIEALKFE